MKEVISAIRNEVKTLNNLMISLNSEQWQLPTKFKDWTPEIIISHLYYFDLMTIYSLNKPGKFDEEAKFLLSTYIEIRQSLPRAQKVLERLKTSNYQELMEGWLVANNLMCEVFEKTDPKERCKWFGPDMGARMFMTARYMETWSHSQAIYDLISIQRDYSDDIKNIANIGVKTFEWTYINRKLEVPKSKPYIQLIAPSGQQWEWNEHMTDNSVIGLASDFCHVVTQNRNIVDTNLEVKGEIAKHWMSIAQCFAGDPEEPPNNGYRV
jgi:uncharacterized protein (TIGR03084 family)